MKGTRNSTRIAGLKGRSVRVTSQAKKVPMTVLITVTPEAMNSELSRAV